MARRADPETATLLAEDSRYFLHQSLSTPCLDGVRRLSGIYIEDIAGRRIMDFHGNNVHHIGYAHPRLIAALKVQLDELTFSPRRYTNRTAVDLARSMAELTGGLLPKCLFAPSGSDAVEIALALARGVTARHDTISFAGSFHGNSAGARSVGGDPHFRDTRLGPLLPGSLLVDPPGGPANDERARECVAAIQAALAGRGHIAALIACPLAPSQYVPPAWFWKDVQRMCHAAGTLLVFDEVPTCLGKTGSMFGWEHYGVTPDIMVTGKALGGSVVPIACVSAREDLDALGDLSIGHYTHEKNPFVAAAALATLRIIREEDLAARAERLGEQALREAAALKARHRLVGSVRGKGLALAIELVDDPVNGVPAAACAERAFSRALEKGLNLKATGGVLALSPPLIITTEELARALEIVDDSLTELEQEMVPRGRRALP